MGRALLLLILAAQPCAAQVIDTLALRAHTRFLSSDLLEGRGTGTRGEQLAALYIASELTRMNIPPANGSDYLVPLPLKRALIDNAATTITFNGTTYQSARDFVWNAGGRGALRDFSGTLLIMGAADSLAVQRAAEARGKVAVFGATLGTLAEQLVPALLKAGAAGVILLVPDSASFELFGRSRGDTRYFVDAAIDDPIWQPQLPVVLAGPALTRAIAARGALTRFATIDAPLTARLTASFDDVKSANIAAVIPGSDPKLATEYVAFSAHYDHLGISTPDARGDSIYNGFSDNAAGVAMLLAIGDVLRRKPPARSVLFLFFTGEERGLLGSTYFASQSPIPLKQITGLINLDAGAPPAPPVAWRIAGGAATPLGEFAKAALATRGWTAELGMASANSDYWPFLKRGVPSIFIIPGRNWENTTDEQQRALRTRWDRYHQAGDEWASDFPFSGIARYAEAALVVGQALGNRR